MSDNIGLSKEELQEKLEKMIFKYEHLKEKLQSYNIDLKKAPEVGDVFGDDSGDIIRRMYVYRVTEETNTFEALSYTRVKDNPNSVFICNGYFDFTTLKYFKFLGKTDINIDDLFLVGSK